MSKKTVADKNEIIGNTISDEKVNNLETLEKNQFNGSDTAEKVKEPIGKIKPKAEKFPIKVGLKVKVKAGSKTYSGVQIAKFVYNYTWFVKEVDGNRIVIDKDTSGKHSILTSIHKDNLILE